MAALAAVHATHLLLIVQLRSCQGTSLIEHVRRPLRPTHVGLSELPELHLLVLLWIHALVSASLDEVLKLRLLSSELLDMRDRSCCLSLSLLSLLLLLLLQGCELLLSSHLQLSLRHRRHLVVLRNRIGEVVLHEGVRFLTLEPLEGSLARLGAEELIKLC